jgi:hypothetical protein
LVKGSEDDVILDCYRLAKWYSVSPEIFLAMPMSEVSVHMWRTGQLDALQRPIKDD